MTSNAAGAGRPVTEDERRRLRHDLRTPLTIVSGFAEVLAADRPGRALHQTYRPTSFPTQPKFVPPPRSRIEASRRTNFSAG